MLTAIWYMISSDTDANDLGAAHFLTRSDPNRQARRLIGQLHQFGFQVTLNPIEQAA